MLVVGGGGELEAKCRTMKQEPLFNVYIHAIRYDVGIQYCFWKSRTQRKLKTLYAQLEI